MRHDILKFGNLGECFIEAGYQNNMFDIYYGDQLDGSTHYSQKKFVLSVQFENGEWSVSGYKAEGTNKHRDSYIVPQAVQELAIEIILASSFARSKLESWRVGAVKRLEKSVPRLKAEYEAASERLEKLKNVSFADV